VPRAATRAAAARLGLCCVYIRILLCGLACGLQSTFLVSLWQPRRCPTRLFGNQHCQWPTQGGGLFPARWVASASLRSMALDRFGRRGISGKTPRGGSFPVHLRTHPRWSERPLGWRGQVRAQPALPEITLASPRPPEAALHGGGPKGTVDRLFHFSHARFSCLCASKH